MKMTLHEIACVMGASCDVSENVSVTKVCIDSRTVQKGDLFVCIVGQKMDGHQFAAQAVEKGACAVVASTPLELTVPVLLVRDTTLALGKLARAWRERTAAKVIGVTGSAGKTTVKEMLAQVLAFHGKTSKNFKNLNNQIGLPLSILEMDGDEAFWVLELGISRPGDMDDLGNILAPDAALIVNIGPCHLEGLGDLAGVAREKCLLLEYVRPGGFGCVNSDYPFLPAEAAKRDVRTVLFGTESRDVQYLCLRHDDSHPGKLIYQMRINGSEQNMTVSANVHLSENMAAVIAMAVELGLTPANIEAALASYAPVTQRFVQTLVGSWLFIDDTYNANPVSMTRSIQEASRLAAGKILALVLADMRELGEESAAAHEKLGQVISESGCDYCFFAGDQAAYVLRGLNAYSGVFKQIQNADEVLDVLSPLRSREGVILFKGSRSCKMENYYTFMERNWA